MATTDIAVEPLYKIEEIMGYLPHRYPMLLVDRILSIEGNTVRAIKNVTMNEPFFQGHYPGKPIMPGVLILEAMAQAGAVLLLARKEYQGMIPLIGAIDDVKLRRPVVPGDQLLTTAELIGVKGSVGRLKAEASVDGQIAATMMMTFKLLREEG
jgi:3-hydroxyacyl-[acyl-carrier-protein] dehydratase